VFHNRIADDWEIERRVILLLPEATFALSRTSRALLIEVHDGRCREPSRLKLAGEPGHHIPSTDRGCALESKGERGFHRRVRIAC
jgi:hypothetical protein